MHLRVELRAPDGESVTLDTNEGVWVEPWGTPDRHLGREGWALPGLVDAHAHLARESLDYLPGDYEGARSRAARALEAGVGLLLDKGWCDLTVIDLIEKVPPWERPDIEAAGRILAVESGYWDGFARNVDPGKVGKAVASAAEEGRGWVKLIGDWPRKGIGPQPNFSEEELAEAVAMAESHGSRVAIHTMAREVPSAAVRAGVHSIEHGLFLEAEDLEVLGARGGSWVPTVLRVEAVIDQLGPESSGGRLLREGLDRIAANLLPAMEAGVKIGAGTDLVVGSDHLAREAIRLWEMGMPPRAVVGAASRVTGGEATSLFPVGDSADAVIFSGDPTIDPRALADPIAVIRMGRLVR